MSEQAPVVLSVDDLHLGYVVRGRLRDVLRGVSFELRQGETYGLVGESGCGKSTVAYTAVRYQARNARVTSGEVRVEGRDVLTLDPASLRRLRAETVSMVYQDPGQALNPTIRIGEQLVEAFTVLGVDRAGAIDQAIRMLRKVQIADPERVMHRFPHQLSGGMLQRVVIAMALACNPKLLILDEPTTGLDATVEAEVLDLVRSLRDEFGTAVLFISHNLAAVRSLSDRVGVLYAGTLVEEGAAGRLFDAPRHHYTSGLLHCLPRSDSQKSTHRLESIPGSLPTLGEVVSACVFADRCGAADDACRSLAPDWSEVDGRRVRCHHPVAVGARHPASDSANTSTVPAAATPKLRVLELQNVSKTFHQAGHSIRALSSVSLYLDDGETLGLVGESGSGKTTLAHTILGLHAPDQGGEITLFDRPAAGRTRSRSRQQQAGLQIVFQNPDSALNRRHSVRRIIGRALKRLGSVDRSELDARLSDMASAVKLSERHLSMRPSQLSGGLKQRVAIARAFAGSPLIVVCDEPTSALDVSVQAAILNLLVDLQRERRSSYLFISHDLRVVRYVSDRIAVMYLGRIVDIGSAERIFAGPHHPYTEALLSAAPAVDGQQQQRIRLGGEIPSPTEAPIGCVFHTRCPRKLDGDLCTTVEPPTQHTPDGGSVSCHIPLEQLSVRRVGAEA